MLEREVGNFLFYGQIPSLAPEHTHMQLYERKSLIKSQAIIKNDLEG